MPDTVLIPCTNPGCNNKTRVGIPLADAKMHCGECSYHPDDLHSVAEYQRLVIGEAIDRIERYQGSKSISEIVKESKAYIDDQIEKGLL